MIASVACFEQPIYSASAGVLAWRCAVQTLYAVAADVQEAQQTRHGDLPRTHEALVALATYEVLITQICMNRHLGLLALNWSSGQ